MTIQQQIEQIIEARKRRLPELDRRIETLKRMSEQIERMDYVKGQMITEDGQTIPDGKYAELIGQNPEMAWNLQALDTRDARRALESAMKELERCHQRFSRDSISISVVGEARIGKSSLLKAVSGLNDNVIPAFESTDCTGAPSIIYNEPGQTMRAEITFKTRRQMLEMAQYYLDKLITDPTRRIHLSSMEQIRGLDPEHIRSLARAGSTDLNKLRYLQRMIDGYDEWSPYAGRPDTLVLTDERDIATFVAQNNGKAQDDPLREEYSKYLAVNTCHIRSPFPLQDAARINLVDTVGLDDDSAGIEESMLRVVRDESDAVVFMLMPRSGVGNGMPKHVTDIYRIIEENCADRDLDKWLFYLINHVDRPSSLIASNTPYCLSTSKALKEMRYHGYENQYVVNARDPQAVREQFLMPMLTTLAGNLEPLDGAFMAKAAAALKALQQEYNQLCVKAQKVLRSDIAHNASLMPLINDLTDRRMEAVRGRLFKLSQQWYERKDQPCPEIHAPAEGILSRMTQSYLPDSYVPAKGAIQDRLELGVQPPQCFLDCENRMRNEISRDFLGVDVELRRFVDGMKDEVATVLCDACGFGAVLKRDTERPPREWLGEFAASVLDEVQYPTLRLAFDALDAFDFSVKGFLTYEVRDALNALDPSHSGTPQMPRNYGNFSVLAASIHTSLRSRMIQVADELKRRLKLLSCKPNMACFAEVSAFYDRLVYAEGAEREWRTLFAEKAGTLWAEEIRRVQTVGVLCKDWIDLVDALAAWNVASNFRIAE